MAFIQDLLDINNPKCIYCGYGHLNFSLIKEKSYKELRKTCPSCDEYIMFIDVLITDLSSKSQKDRVDRLAISCYSYDIMYNSNADNYSIFRIINKTYSCYHKICDTPKFDISCTREILLDQIRTILVFS